MHVQLHATEAELKDDRLISHETTWGITGNSRSSHYLKIKTDPDYPKPVKIGKLQKFSYRECQEYVAKKLAERDAA